MTRNDIRRGTLIIMVFAITCLIGICASALLRGDRDVAAKEQQITDGEGKVWSDRLSNAASDHSPLSRMDREIERFMARYSIHGMSLAVTRHDSLIYAKGYGWADEEEGVQMTPKHIMRIASASKLVTAIAIMRLVEQGKFTLDSKVFGPDGILNDTLFTNAIHDPRLFDITVDHLLRHMGGFGMGAGDPMFNTKDIIHAKQLDAAPTNEELTRIVLGRKIAFTPGKGRRYSNFGYMLLSLVIEKATGKTYWDYVTDEVLEPAGCYRFRPATNYYSDRLPDETRYYGPDTVAVEEFNGSGRMVERVYGGSNVNGLMGAGGWLTSASDLARLVAATDGDKRVADILTQESVDSLTAFDEKDKKARGWSETSAQGKWTRTGTLSSTHTLVQRFPDGECWVLITNSGVWTGHKFSHDMVRLVDRIRAIYRNQMPKRNLW